MVCVSCFVLPVLCWIWFTFIMPLVYKLKEFLFPNSVKPEDKENIAQKAGLHFKCSDSTASCPFTGKNKTAENQEETKKVN